MYLYSMQANDFPKPYTIQWVINDCCSHSPRLSVSHKVVKSVSPERWVKSTWFQAVATKLTAEWHVEIPWLNGACLPTHLLPAVKKGHIAAFWGVPCCRDLLIPARPAAATGRLWLRLCSSCAPCPWVPGVDFLTALHLALKFPSFWAVRGDRFQFDSVPPHGSHPLSCVSGVAAAAEWVLARCL